MSAIGALWRALRQRAGVSAGIALVAVVAAAAASNGPAYDAAARTSVLRDALATPTVLNRAVEASVSGPARDLAPSVTSQAGGVLAAHLGGAAQGERIFGSPVQDVRVQSPLSGRGAVGAP